MNFVKKKILKTLRVKESGNLLELMISLFCVIFVILLLVYGYRIRAIFVTKNISDDSVVASLLAGAIVDVDKYGTDHVLIIRDFDESWNAYKTSLPINLGIHDDYTVDENPYFASRVTVHQYIVYNVEEIYQKDVDGNLVYETNPDGTLKYETNPDGTLKYETKSDGSLRLDPYGNPIPIPIPVVLEVKVNVTTYNNDTEYSGAEGGTILSDPTRTYSDTDAIDIKAPDGMKIEATTLYSDIGFLMEGYAGTTQYVHIKKAVDIVENDGVAPDLTPTSPPATISAFDLMDADGEESEVEEESSGETEDSSDEMESSEIESEQISSGETSVGESSSETMEESQETPDESEPEGEYEPEEPPAEQGEVEAEQEESQAEPEGQETSEE